MRHPTRFNQAEITRLMAGARAAGFTRLKLGIDPNGSISLDASDDVTPVDQRPNPLDRLLSDENTLP